MSRLLIFGLGYTATRIAGAMRARGWQVDATGSAGTIAFDDERAVADALARATHVELAVLACASVVLLIVLLASGDALATAAAQMLSSLDTAGATLVIAGGVAFLGHALVTRAISLPRRVFS